MFKNTLSYSGFSLIETCISLLLISIVLAALQKMLLSNFANTNEITSKIEKELQAINSEASGQNKGCSQLAQVKNFNHVSCKTNASNFEKTFFTYPLLP